MSGAAAGGNGQAPTQQPASSADGHGQAPAAAQANNGAPAPTGSAPNGQAPTATGQNDPTAQLSADEAKRIRQELEEARRDAAKYRDELKKRDDANLSAQQKLERDFAETQAKNLQYEQRLQRLALENAGYRLGSSLGIGDVGAALALVQTEHQHELKFSATDGTPENLPELLKAVLKDHPALAAQNTPAQQRPQASSGGATNPGSGGTAARGGNAGTSLITRASYAAMSPQEKIARNKEVLEVMRQNGGRLPD